MREKVQPTCIGIAWKRTHQRRFGRACASSLRQLVGRAPDLDAAKEDAVHCASWIDAGWECKIRQWRVVAVVRLFVSLQGGRAI